MTFSTTRDLARRWHVSPATVRWRLLQARGKGQGPTPAQIVRLRGRTVAYRADYVARLEASPIRGAR